MELRALAEQVLFATTLEEKLGGPANLTDDHPGPARAAPAVPGRPAGLGFKASGGRSDFPGLHRLENERERGRVLHFFANHELLATELMALVLLRFPEAPAAFRRGVLRTLREEQEHTRLYLGRMQACGLEFGELPVSGYFWRSVSTMESPLDYVAGLSLTFEQANLDFARQFSNGFAAVGDEATAHLLERIYRDEIGHVAYGLKWFRRWKDPGQSDWHAYCAQLKAPLSPQRAKGGLLNADGRRAAGLDEAFIAELDVYARSRGRTPSVFVFNPFAEGFLARGAGFTPVKHQAQLAADLASVPQFLARQDDIVLVPRRPSAPFLKTMQQAGFALPEFVELQRGQVPMTGPSSLEGRKLGPLRPWAWGPDSVALLQPLAGQVTGGPAPVFNDAIAGLYAKAWSADWLAEFLTSHPASWLCTPAEVGVAVASLDEALGVIEGIRRRGHHRVVVKESLGLAGHNAIRLWEPEILPDQRRWMAQAVQGGALVVEPWLEREVDFSVQFEMTPRGLQLVGFAGLLTDRRGQYRGNWAEPGHARRLPARLAALLRTPADIHTRLLQCYEMLRASLEAKLRPMSFLGPISIDAFVYRLGPEECRLKPVVEINPRSTMGRLTLELMTRACPGSGGRFRLLTRSHVRAEGADDFVAYARMLAERSPVRMEGAPVPRIREGALCLNDPEQARACLAVFEIFHSKAPQASNLKSPA